MAKERLVAFTDAVLAIIMTVLVLELERPEHISWSAVWDLRMNYLAYTISFFWLGTMWVNMHRVWDGVKQINNTVVWISMLLLFFSSFFPYTTSLVSAEFHNPVGQALYGIVTLLVTAMNILMYRELRKLQEDSYQGESLTDVVRARLLDIVIKLVGLLLTLTILPEAMMWAVLVTAVVIIIPRSI
ncbi:TMEM175 family protein [Streptococcus sp. NLN64]|uniref:TMEM175 family protein n=1 Tax=Streptococcus sp. NLN64 TaxID=2822799 RepID=UPI0018CB2C8C|nr:TMEM175 family protein [Streptococcus sp. NLN64]MBG9367302.1 DUF1211 domain-containing protein [Streptococcus sp. NLN64]